MLCSCSIVGSSLVVVVSAGYSRYSVVEVVAFEVVSMVCLRCFFLIDLYVVDLSLACTDSVV